MTLYRGAGGTGEARTDTDVTEVRIIADEAEGYKDAAAASAMAAASSAAAALQAETNAELAETNAETAETNAEAAQAAAEAAQAAAEAAQLAAETAQTAAELAETNAETAETNAELAEVNAEAAQAAAASFASSADSSASTATTQASNAATSASTATTQAGIATTKAGEAVTSATAAQAAQTSAEAARDAALAAYDNFDDRYLGPKASDPTLDNDGNALLTGALYFNTTTNVMKVYEGSVWVAAYVSAAGVLLASNNLSDLTNVSTARTNLGLGTAALVDDSTLVHKTGDETIAGTKTFSSTISGSVSGNAGTVTNGVYTSGDQTIAGTKTFSSTISGSITGNSGTVTNGVYTTGSYADPAWITSLAGSKISGNITGNAANVTGTVAIANGGTGATTASGARTNLDALAATNPSYTGTLTGGTGVVNLGSGQFYKDASGNIGLGVTPSAWNSSYVGFQVGSGVSLWGTKTGATGTYLSNNVVFDTTGNRKYLYTGTAAEYVQSGGIHSWYTAPSGTAGNAISFTQAMTLNASGNLGIGSTSPLSTVGRVVQIYNSGTTVATVQLQDSTTGSGASDGLQLQVSGTTSYLWNYENGPLIFGTNNSERARIDSSGNLLVGTTSGFGIGKLNVVSAGNGGIYCSQTSTGGYAYYSKALSNGGTYYHFQFVDNGTGNGSITSNGTTVSYNTSSDYRLKKQVQPMTGALAKVTALKPVTYKWKSDGSDGEGFIAHELAEVVPQCVTGEKDAVDADGNPQYQGIDTSFLVATLTAAIQEQQALIASQSEIINAQQAALTALTARVEALEPN